jgi:hypothetical protein
MLFFAGGSGEPHTVWSRRVRFRPRHARVYRRVHDCLGDGDDYRPCFHEAHGKPRTRERCASCIATTLEHEDHAMMAKFDGLTRTPGWLPHDEEL